MPQVSPGLDVRRAAFYAALLTALLSLSMVLAPRVWASLPQGRVAAPQAIAPADGGIVSESGLRFAWTPAPGAQRHLLLVSREPFDPSRWSRLSDVADGVRAIELKTPVASPAEAGLTFDADGPLYWAGASELRGGGLRVSTMQSTHVLRKFANRVEQSPLLSVSPVHPIAASGEARAADRIRLRSGFVIDPAQGEPAVPQALRLSAVPTSGRRAVIAYYGSADPEQTRRSILASGGTIVSYLPDHAFLVRMPAAAPLHMSAEGSWTGDWQPAYKLSPRLPSDPAQVTTATVLAFADADWASVRRAAEFAGVSVVLESRNGINQLMRVRATPSQLQSLAQSAEISWIEPYVQPQLDNANAEWIVQTGASLNRRLWDLGLHGEGQVVLTSDSGVNMGHNAFKDPLVPVTDFGDYPTHRKVIAYHKGSNVAGVAFGDHGVFHGSHTAGTAVGNDDALGVNANDGMAKGAKLWHEDLSGVALGNGIAPPADLNDLYTPGWIGNAGGAARIGSNSWGAPVNGDYDVESFQVDQFMWNHPDFLLFFSTGNSAAIGTVGSPSTAKDCVSAGGSGNNTLLNTLYNSTSRGPAQDGRRKPTICAPGQSVVSSTTGTATYSTLSGTSMASPCMAGAAALMRQYLTEGWYPTGSKVPANGFQPSAALLKAMCVNSGNNMITGFNAPDNNVGWGRINADSACYFAGDARRLLLVDQTDGLAHGQTINYQVNVVDGSIPLKVSLVWTDFPGNPAVTAQLVNNLNLTVTNGVTTYLGNVFTGGLSQTGGSADNVNVEEGVRIAAPATGVWTVRVDAVNVPTGPQPYGLVITGGIGTDAGTLALDRASYGATSTVELRVTDNNAGPSVTVHLTSTTEPAGENVVLAGSNGIYSGTIALSPVTGFSGDGTLQVANGDGITATYTDAAPAATLNATALVDLVPPIITAVGSANQGSGLMLVTWTTNAGATSRVYYGTTPDLGSASSEDPTLVSSHQLSLSGVAVGQSYYYDVESKDVNGNATRDDNGGLHYRFTVNPAADVLLVYDSPQFERPQSYADALGTLGWSYDVWQGSLATNPQLGDLAGGMRAYKAVWWQNGLENYPPFSDNAMTAVTSYLDNGGRMVVVGNDIGWANADGTSPYFSAARGAWMVNTLRTQYDADPPGWTGVTGVAGDPITDAFAVGVPYLEHRAGASGDEITPIASSGTISTIWNSVETTPAPAGLRWESAGPLGTPGTGVWAGSTSKLVAMYFEWTSVDVFNTPASIIRNDIMQRTLLWLIGRQPPTVTVTAPNGGEVLTGFSTNITWTEATFGGTGVASRTIEYSQDDGQSWTTLTTSAGPSPYSWSLGAVPNSNSVRVRVRVVDNGTPSLSGVDASNATFAISRAGGDTQGPVVVAGSIVVNPNPVSNSAAASSSATLTDAGHGNSTITAAEWSFGDIPAPAGGGHAMSGTFGTTSVNVSAALATGSFPPGTRRLWVRGRDAVGNWGPAGSLSIVVNGSPVASVTDRPVDFGLEGNIPNPVAHRTTITYSLPVRSPVDLRIFDVTGRQVKRLVGESIEAGVHHTAWDRRDDQGRLVLPGVYYYRLAVAGRSFERRLVTMN